MKQTIITCDGCGKKAEPWPMGEVDVQPLSIRAVRPNAGGLVLQEITADLCSACQDRLAQRYATLDPSTWKPTLIEEAIAREPMQRQERPEPSKYVTDRSMADA